LRSHLAKAVARLSNHPSWPNLQPIILLTLHQQKHPMLLIT